MKFIGHLDLMRYFQKAIRRADLDICYSAGYHPHQIMSFASPLGVGLTSEGEYLDIEVHHSPSSSKAISLLNQQMVEGIAITNYIQLPEKAKNAMSIVAAADYLLYSEQPGEAIFTAANIEDFFANHQKLMVTKKTKKKEIEMDLIPDIHYYEATAFNNKPALKIRLSAGSEKNIKPSLFLAAYTAYFDKKYSLWDYPIHRVDVYTKESNGFVSLNDLGVEISE